MCGGDGRGPRRGCGCRPRRAAWARGSSRRSRGRSAAGSASDRRAGARPSHSLFAAFLASRDRVKGRGECSKGGGGSGDVPLSRTAGRFVRDITGATLLRAVTSFSGAVGDETGRTSLRKRDHDLVEIAGGDAVSEHLTRLFEH